MTDPITHSGPADVNGEDVSLLAIGSVLLRRRRLVGGLFIGGALIGFTAGVLETRSYVSSATLIPRSSEGSSTSGLALAASQLGLRGPTSVGGWGAPIYVELLHSRALLEPIARDSVLVPERSAQKIAVMDLLGQGASSDATHTDLAVRQLESFVNPSENKALGAVKFTVTTKWPSFSHWLAEQLVKGVGRFNMETRRSQAAEERWFVEKQAAEAEKALRAAEDRQQSFLQRNRVTSAPEVDIELQRLRREVILRQQVHSSLVQNQEEARIREVRDTPVITLLEEPRLPLFAESRKVALKLVLGGLGGGVLGVLIAFLMQGLAGARGAQSDEAREFFGLLDELTPRFLRKRGR